MTAHKDRACWLVLPPISHATETTVQEFTAYHSHRRRRPLLYLGRSGLTTSLEDQPEEQIGRQYSGEEEATDRPGQLGVVGRKNSMFLPSHRCRFGIFTPDGCGPGRGCWVGRAMTSTTTTIIVITATAAAIQVPKSSSSWCGIQKAEGYIPSTLEMLLLFLRKATAFSCCNNVLCDVELEIKFAPILHVAEWQSTRQRRRGSVLLRQGLMPVSWKQD